MRVICACGNQSDEIIRGIATGFSKFDISYTYILGDRGVYSHRGRPLDGYAIDIGGDVTDSSQVLLTSADRIPFIGGFSEGIMILSPTYQGDGCCFATRGYIISSQETQIPPTLKKYPLISCGMGAKDTVTYSSLTPRKEMICIQRRLSTFDGRVIEPQEFPAEGNGFITLAVFTAMLLCDVIK